MKTKTLFLLIGLLLGMGSTFAQGVYVTFSGYVTSMQTGSPVSNHEVIASSFDSLFSSTAIAYTDTNGAYSMTMLVSGPNMIYIMVQTNDLCNPAVAYTNFVSTQTATNVNFEICTNSSSACTSSFTWNSSNPLQNEVIFNNTSTSSMFGTIISTSWDFGDGSQSTLTHPVHNYATPGYYQVCLAIQTSDSCWSSYCDFVMAGDSVINPIDCEAYFYAYPDSNSNQVYFNDLSWSNTSIISYFWNFADGTASTQQDPVHTFAASGVYTVCLTIMSADSCTSTYCMPVVVGNVISNCMAAFSAMPTGNPLEMNFTDQSIGNVVQWNWNFGDSTLSTAQNPVHAYAGYGAYYVCLTIQTADSCTSSYCDFVYVMDSIAPNTVSGQVLAAGNPVSSGAVVLMSNNGLTFTATISNGDYYFYSVPNGTYIAYAIPSPFLYSNFTPTYFDSALFWTDATEIIVNNASVNGVNIYLNQLGGTANGNGSISGTIIFINPSKTYQNTFNESAGNINLYIMDLEDNLLFHTVSNAEGLFEFIDLPYDTYKLYIELAGHTSYPAVFTLDENMSSITNISVEISGGTIVILSDELLEANLLGLRVYPNPVESELFVELNQDQIQYLSLHIYNAVGQQVATKVISETINHIDVAQLAKGVYYLKVNHPILGSQTIKFVK